MLDLELAVREGEGERMECSLTYNLELYNTSTADRMLNHLTVRLSLLLQNTATSFVLAFACHC